jgi:hypothetical protein
MSQPPRQAGDGCVSWSCALGYSTPRQRRWFTFLAAWRCGCAGGPTTGVTECRCAVAIFRGRVSKCFIVLVLGCASSTTGSMWWGMSALRAFPLLSRIGPVLSRIGPVRGFVTLRQTFVLRCHRRISRNTIRARYEAVVLEIAAGRGEVAGELDLAKAQVVRRTPKG